MGSLLRRSHRLWLLKVVGVLASCLAAGLVTAGVVSGTSAFASLTSESTETETTAAPSGPSIRAEKDDYVPSEIVTLWGDGWVPGESVEVFVNDDEGKSWSHTGTTTADELGAFMYELQLPDWFVATYSVTATGDAGSLARSSFADSVAVGASSTNSSGGGGMASQQLTISAPAVSIGDVLVAQVAIADSITNTVICSPAGWTSVLNNTRDDKIRQHTFWFRASAAAGSTSYTWQFRNNTCAGSLIGTGTKGASGGITRFAGVVASGSPIDVSAGANSSSSGPFTAPSVTTTVADTRILRYFAIFKNTDITDPPAAPAVPRLYHESSSSIKERAVAAFDSGAQAGAGPTGSYTVNLGSTAEGAYQTLALKSAVAVASDAPVVGSPICAGATEVSGTSSEAAGTQIEVFVDGASAGTTTVQAGGTWAKSGIAALLAGDQVTARATASGETTSPDSAIVTVVACNAAPAAPADLGQFRSNGATAISVGGYTNETTVVLKGALTDPDASDMVRLQVEVKPVGTAFDGLGLVSGSFVADPATASATVSGLVHGTGYHWRARALDDDAAASAWEGFGGNAESAADFTVDTVDPTLTASATSPPGGPAYVAGTWTNQDVKVAFACADALSGVATDTVPDVTVSTDGANQSVTSTGDCVDAAGNAADAATFADIDLDKTAPANVATALGRGPDHNGWYNAPVGWATTGEDATSGIASCSSGTYDGPDGTGLTVSGSCTDVAGNTASDTSDAFDYDATAPTDVATVLDRGPDQAGWYNAPVGWATTGLDETSGIDDCDTGTYDGPDGTGVTVLGTCTDVAGNNASALSAVFDYDATAPGVEVVLERVPDHDGWYNAPVGWEALGTDAGSGLASCSSGTYGGPDGTGLTVSGSCTDVAGNTASGTSDAFDYDATAPEVETTLDRSPDHNGWYNAPVGWETHGTDATSGIDTCSSGTHSADGSGLTVSGSCSDQAGNSASDTSDAFDYDATDPADVETTLDRGPDHNGWYNAAVGWTTNGTDATSGVADCDQGTYAGPDATGLTVSGSCTDNAGNESAPDASDAFDYDATDPSLSPTVTPSPVLVNGAATASPNATDNLSGVASSSCATPDTSTVGAKSVTCTATDNAGNQASANAWYSVVYSFQGFFQPVDNNGVYNVVQAGRAIPLKFSLGGYQGMGILASGYPAWTIVSCTAGTGTDPLEETLTAGSSALQYDATAGQYVYVWKTEKSWASSCRRLDVKLVDGSTHSAYFSFKK